MKSVNPLWIITIILVLALIIGLLACYSYVIRNYTVTTVYVEGNVHYTNEEIMDMVMDGSLQHWECGFFRNNF